MGSASVQAPRVVAATAKLELLEAMLDADDVVGCVERALAWLAEHAGVTHAICALADVERGELIAVGGHRVTPAQIEKVAARLGDTADPWIQAMGSRTPRFFRSRSEEKNDRARAEHPFGRSGYWAVPLGTSNMANRPAEGLLLVRRRGADGRSDMGGRRSDQAAAQRSCPPDAGRRREPAAPGTFAAPRDHQRRRRSPAAHQFAGTPARRQCARRIVVFERRGTE